MTALRILLVDDEELSRRALTAMIAKTGLDVQIVGQAADGEEALRQTEELRPDLVIMDIKMPELNGLDAARIIRERWEDVHVIFLTAYDEFEYARDAVNLGADRYLLKPVDRDDLDAALREVGRRLAEPISPPIVPDQGELRRIRRWAAQQVVLAVIAGDQTRYRELLHFLLPQQDENHERDEGAGGVLALVTFSRSCENCLENLEKSFGRDELVCTLPTGDTTGVLYIPGRFEGASLTALAERVLRRCSRVLGGDCRLRVGATGAVGLASRRLYHRLAGEGDRDTPLTVIVADNAGAHGAGLLPREMPDLQQRVDTILAEVDAGARQGMITALLQEISLLSEDLELLRELAVELVVLFRTQIVSISGADSAAIGRGYLQDLHRAPSGPAVLDSAATLLRQYEQYFQGLHLGRYSWRLARAVDYILTNLGQNLYLDIVAEAVGVGAQHLSRLFKEELDSTFTRFVNQQRIDRARYLLLSSSLGVAEIAEAVGFRDADYFSKVFRRLCSCAPSEYRSSLGHSAGRVQQDGDGGASRSDE